jgi:peptide/nickel transport system permease protein
MISWRGFFSRWHNVLGLVIVLAFGLTALAAPLLAPPEDPSNPAQYKIIGSISNTPKPPSEEAILGTVPGSLDVYYTLIWGTRSAFRVGLLVTILTAVLGIFIGSLSAYAGGRINTILMRVTDAFLAFPTIAGVALFSQILIRPGFVVNPGKIQLFLAEIGVGPILLTLICFSWMPYARLMNSMILRLTLEEFIEAAHALGSGPFRIIFRHLIPNALSPIIVLAARDVGGMVLLAAGFTFIGFPGGTTWGTMLVNARSWVVGPAGNPLTFWWTFIPFTIVLLAFGIGWNLLGDGLNTMFHPHLAKEYHYAESGGLFSRLIGQSDTKEVDLSSVTSMK